jgi:hypothetical protein
MSEDPSRPGSPLWLPVAAALLGLAWLARTSQVGLMGWDAWPMVATSAGDFLGVFAEPLMDGYYDAGAFYRPLASLTLALDHALWGLRPFGYQLGSAVLLAACLFAAGRLAWQASRSQWACAVTVGVLALHPVGMEVVPVPPRRPELLTALFALLAVSAQIAPRTAAGLRVAPALFALLAMASKETGMAVPALLGAIAAIDSGGDARARLREAGRAMLLPAAALALFLAVRVAVLGGLGGPAHASPEAVLRSAPDTLSYLVGELLFPQVATTPPVWALGVGGIAFALLSLVVGTGPLRRTAAIGAVWLLIFVLAAIPAGAWQPWYAWLPLPGVALVLGAAAASCAARWRGGDRGRAALGLGLVALLLLPSLRYASLAGGYEEWQRATAASDAFLGELADAVEAAPDGARLVAPPIPRRVPPGRPPTVRGGAILTRYSVAAWARLRFPERHVRVLERGGSPRPAPDEVLVAIPRQQPGFEQR